MRYWGKALLVACVVLAILAPAAAAGSSSNPPPPPGANKPQGCDPQPQVDDPTPVVLVHGTSANRSINFINLSPMLDEAGYCVFALNYGNCNEAGSCGRGRIQHSARQLRRFINRRVLEHSESGKVSIVGHSQGALMSRYYIKFLGGRSLVEDMIGVAGSNHGTNTPLAPFSPNCPACHQQHPYMSKFTRTVNEGDETPGRIDYTQIQTRFDEVVIPYFSAFLTEKPSNDYNGPKTTRMNGPNTTNFCLQDQYPSTTEHNDIIGSPDTFEVILDALETDGPASPPRNPDSVCARLGGDPGGGSGDGGGGGDQGDGDRCTIRGTSGNNVLYGTRRDDVICGGGGNDVIYGGGGDDTLRGDAGNDALFGEDGNDRLNSGAGNDALDGEDGRDSLDTRDGVSGNDAADGGAGSDGCSGDPGDRLTSCS
jgi:triacylglycerol lipase